MSKRQSHLLYIRRVEKKFSKEMPRIRKEISVYEENLKNGKINTNPIVAPQFK